MKAENIIYKWASFINKKRKSIKVFLIDAKEQLKLETIKFTLTEHFINRAKQRNISEEEVVAILMYGETYFSNNAAFHIVKNSKKIKEISSASKRIIEGLVVVTDPTEKEILTVYRNRNPFKYLRKSKAIA